MLIRLRDRGDEVRELQELLISNGLKIEVDGIFGWGTHAAVKKFQSRVGLRADGIVGNMTIRALRGYKTISRNPIFKDDVHYPLNEWEYYPSIYTKKQIYLHHTASTYRPDYVIDWWGKDRARSGGIRHVGTFCVVGGKGEHDDRFDGVIYKCFEPRYWAHHLGLRQRNNKRLNQQSIGIELCNIGAVVRINGQWRSVAYNNKFVIPEDQVVDLGFSWRGYRYWQKYSDKQIETTVYIIRKLANSFDIDCSKSWTKDSFELNDSARRGERGLWTHAQVRSDKFDCYPSPRLIAALNDI